MKRLIYNKLLDWKNEKQRKPLILKGARQVGKTYILEDFGKKEFDKYHLFNFEDNPQLSELFEQDFSVERILKELSLFSNNTINSKSDLLIFDEIQECPKAITSLKYFCEKAPELAICCAGSLLGIELSNKSFPVGKVAFLSLYPLCFEEFLMAQDDSSFINIFNSVEDYDRQSDLMHKKLWDVFKEYLITGGMPEVVRHYVECKDDLTSAYKKVRDIQKGLIEGYYKDFAKHSGKVNSMHISSVFENIPLQLSKDVDDSVDRYKFKNVIPNKRTSVQLEGPINWLQHANLIIKVKIANRSEIPIESFCKNNIFKLFLFDIGLLSCMLDLPILSLRNDNYGITKGYIAENFVAQEFIAAGMGKLHSWSERNSEIEFIFIDKDEIVPVEVKSGKRVQAKSLSQYIVKYNPNKAIILSAKPRFKAKEGVIWNYPLYYAGRLRGLR